LLKLTAAIATATTLIASAIHGTSLLTFRRV
jgi:hypothetical protein